MMQTGVNEGRSIDRYFANTRYDVFLNGSICFPNVLLVFSAFHMVPVASQIAVLVYPQFVRMESSVHVTTQVSHCQKTCP